MSSWEPASGHSGEKSNPSLLEAMRVCGDCAESLQEGLESREECVRPEPLRGFLEEAGLRLCRTWAFQGWPEPRWRCGERHVGSAAVQCDGSAGVEAMKLDPRWGLTPWAFFIGV